MDLNEFSSEIYRYAEVHGQPYIPEGNTAQLWPLLDKCFAEIVAHTKCLYSDNVTLTLTAGEGTYNLRDTAIVSKRVHTIDSVIMDGGILFKFDGHTGPTPIEASRLLSPNYLDATDAKPTMWVALSKDVIRFIPAPDDTYDCVVSGWVLHDLLETHTQDIEFEDEDLYPVIEYCARRLILPYASGDSFEKAQLLRQLNRESLAMISEAAASPRFRSSRRGQLIPNRTRL